MSRLVDTADTDGLAFILRRIALSATWAVGIFWFLTTRFEFLFTEQCHITDNA